MTAAVTDSWCTRFLVGLTLAAALAFPALAGSSTAAANEESGSGPRATATPAPVEPVPDSQIASDAGPADANEVKPGEERKEPAVSVRYRGHKLVIATADENWAVQLQWRLQFRYTFPLDDDPQNEEDFAQPDRSSFEVRRARLKVGGNAYRPWLDYSLEYDFPSNNLLDWRFTLERFPAFQLRAGQWKVNYSRERISSSGAQQLGDRSIVNDIFTVDRQEGAMLMGHIFEGSLADSWYHAGVFSGTGAGGGGNDDDEMMWVGRYQWNFLGRDLGFEQSDLERTPQPTASIAGAGAHNRSPFTRFSSSGGSQLPGFEAGGPGRYIVDQFMLETAFKWQGLWIQHESHWKEVEDTETNVDSSLTGTYVQAGYFFHGLVDAFPAPLELAARVAFVSGDAPFPGDEREITVGANWFFAGHANKLTSDISWLSLDDDSGTLEITRFRLQWDISF